MSPEKTLEATFRAGNLALARQMALAMLKKNVGNKTALQVLAHIALLIGVPHEALAIAGKAHDVDPDDPRTNLLLADIHGARGHTGRALAYCDRVLGDLPGDVSALQLKARHLERAGRWREALELLLPAVAVAPKATQLVLTLARCYMRSGDFDSAITVLDGVLPHITGDSPAARQQRASVLGLRGRVLDRAGRYDEAWADAGRANATRAVKYKPESLSQQVDHLINWFSAERVAQLAGASPTDARHVFIVGMPRSGTTLVEQILDAHPQVTGLGEIRDIDVTARMLPQTMQLKTPFPDCLTFADAMRLDRLVSAYGTAIENGGFEANPVYVNKNLRNPFLLGFIAMLFPEARVIFIERDARDCGVSSFMAGMNPELFPYLFDVDHIAAAVKDYRRLNDHWRTVLPVQWMDLRYEDLVSDQEGNTRRLLEFCGLEWDAACLRFWESERTVMTESYDQVTRPMYDDSVGRYRHYEKHIAPLMALMDEH